MARGNRETLGTLGRSPARKEPTPPPREPPAPEVGFVRRWIHGALFDNVGLKFLSMVLAITVFLLVNTDKDREISARVRVAYALPEDKVLVSDRLEEVRITVKGPWQRLRKFDERQIEDITLDLRRAPTGDIPITPDMIKVPPGLTITSVSPRMVHVAFDRRVEKIVEVSPQVAGHPQHGYLVSEVKAAPTTIKVRGAESTLAALSTIQTQEVSVDGRAESFTKESEARPPDGVEIVGSPTVTVHVSIDEELVTRKLPGLGVAVRGDNVDPTKWSVTPAQVEVTLTGTLLAVEKAKEAIVPMVKLAKSDGQAREVAVSVEGLPPGIGVKISPEHVKVTPVKLPPAPPPSP